jgi:hypothetical protein
MRYGVLFLLFIFSFAPPLYADVTRATPLMPSIQGQQLVVDGQITLGMTPTMEKALLHGIAVEYSIQVKLIDPEQWFWQNTLASKKMRVRLSYDPLKQTYLLSNLTLSRLNTDRDLLRSLTTLGSIQSFPLIAVEKLQANKSYALKLEVSLERDSLPNALRLASLIDREWRVNLSGHPEHWTYQP